MANKKPTEAIPFSLPPAKKSRVDSGGPSNVAETAEKSNDPLMCETYAELIDEYHRDLEKEANARPDADYIKKVEENVTKEMRGQMVDWLAEVASNFKLCPDTLYMSVSHFDRFLSKKAVDGKSLRLVAAASVLLAIKYEEESCTNTPTAKELSDRKDILEKIYEDYSRGWSKAKFEVRGRLVQRMELQRNDCREKELVWRIGIVSSVW